MGPQFPLRWVVGGDQQRTAGVMKADALPLHPVHPPVHHREQHIGDTRLQEIELIDVEHASVGLRQQPRLEDRTPVPDRGRHINGTQQAILADPQGHLHEWRRDESADGCAADCGAMGPCGVIPVARIGGVCMTAGASNGPDRRQQGMQGAGQH